MFARGSLCNADLNGWDRNRDLSVTGRQTRHKRQRPCSCIRTLGRNRQVGGTGSLFLPEAGLACSTCSPSFRPRVLVQGAAEEPLASPTRRRSYATHLDPLRFRLPFL